MSVEATPYINFGGRAREAMTFYQSILGGKLDLFAEKDGNSFAPAEEGDLVMHSRLEADGAVIQATDGSPDYPATTGDNIAVAISGPDKERLSAAFTKLGEGGMIKMPLTPAPWGADFGYLVDKFGINWMFSVGG